MVRVRFAPSPTGFLHVGGARTAIFNWLFARHHGGKFILRIEDTDFARSSDAMVDGILQGMRWLGLDWDEGPVFQSRRIAQHQAFAAMLLETGSAYRCFCAAEDLAARRAALEKAGTASIYDRRCRAISGPDSNKRAQGGEPFAVRFQVPDGKTTYVDQVFGRLEVDNGNIEDFVLLRSDAIPTYNLSVVVDDLDMDITHVVRGADHVSNTPKQIMLYQASGRPLPGFAHLPLILGPDKQRLSKRHGATSVMAYAEQGYLPEAFFNFLALLGWSPGDNKEILSRAELAQAFSLEGVGRANAVFGLEKLDWFNGQYINREPIEQLRRHVIEELTAKGIWEETYVTPDSLDRTLELLRPRARKLTEFSGRFRAFFTDDFPYDTEAVTRFLQVPGLAEALDSLHERYLADTSFSLETTEQLLREVAEKTGLKAGALISALRVGLTGQGTAPGLFEIMQVLGREKTLSRIKRLRQYLE
jgi:glutamyl-tRNA synthetase